MDSSRTSPACTKIPANYLRKFVWKIRYVVFLSPMVCGRSQSTTVIADCDGYSGNSFSSRFCPPAPHKWQLCMSFDCHKQRSSPSWPLPFIATLPHALSCFSFFNLGTFSLSFLSFFSFSSFFGAFCFSSPVPFPLSSCAAPHACHAR